MSLLSICQAVAADTPVAIPSAIVTNSDTNALLLLACAQRAGTALAKYKGGGWDAMIREFVFPTVAVTTVGTLTAGSKVITGIPSTAALSQNIFGVASSGVPGNAVVASVDSGSQVTMDQAATASGAVALIFGQFGYALPADFDRVVTDTEWDRSRRWPLIGPRSPQQWQLYKSGLIGSANFQRRWRIKEFTVAGVAARYFTLDPMPTDNGSQLVFEYVAKSFCQSAGGVAQTSWLADTDTGILDEDLLMLGTRWRFLNRLGLAYAEELDEYERETAKAFANDGGMAILDLAPRKSSPLIGPWNIPDTGFGGVNG